MNPKPSASSRPSRARTGLRAWLASLAAVVLTACGGGDTVEPFEPSRMLVFGDEHSVVTADGRKYGINDLDAAGALACAGNPNWAQEVARNLGLVFAECRSDGRAATALMRATAGARAADAQAAIDAYFAADAPTPKDLVTVLVGMHDVLELYAAYTARGEAALVADLEARGRALARTLNRVATSGPAVLVFSVPDLGLTPYALAEKAAHADTDRAALLTRLSEAFNRGLRLEVINDGRLIGMVFADEQVQLMVRFPGSFGLRNVTTAACANAATPPETSPAALLACTNATGALVGDATDSTWLWADTLRLGPTGQARLGLVALSRVRNNPF